MTSVTENGRKLDEVSNFRPLSLSSPTRGFFQMSVKVPFLLGLLVIQICLMDCFAGIIRLI